MQLGRRGKMNIQEQVLALPSSDELAEIRRSSCLKQEQERKRKEREVQKLAAAFLTEVQARVDAQLDQILSGLSHNLRAAAAAGRTRTTVVDIDLTYSQFVTLREAPGLVPAAPDALRWLGVGGADPPTFRRTVQTVRPEHMNTFVMYQAGRELVRLLSTSEDCKRKSLEVDEVLEVNELVTAPGEKVRAGRFSVGISF